MCRVCDKVRPPLDGARRSAYARLVGRAPRIDGPGWHHVNTTSVDGVLAVGDERDARRFTDIATAVVRRFRWRCAAYCLLGTHYHLLVSIDDETLARGMHVLNSSYARAYNERHDRKGHVFGARYYSVLVQSQSHLLETFRYIDLNPVRARLCSDPAGWAWSSYLPIMGLSPAPAFLDVSAALELFGRTPETARAEYARFVRLGMEAA
jgi:putative transposase